MRTHLLRNLIEECRTEWRRQGSDETHGDLSPADCDWIISQLGRKPTREEWRDAGFRYVGSAHCADL